MRNGKFGTLSDKESGNKIVGGQVALRGESKTYLTNSFIEKHFTGEFPWQVSLQLKTGWLSRHICGGAVLSRHWIVTAGHCVANLKPKALTVVAGEHDLFRDDGKINLIPLLLNIVF